MQSYTAATKRSIRHTVASLLVIAFFLLWGVATIALFNLNENDMPGYPLFYVCTIALIVCSILMGMKRAGGDRGIQLFSALAFVGLLLTNVRHDITALVFDLLFLGGAASLAEWVRRIEICNPDLSE